MQNCLSHRVGCAAHCITTALGGGATQVEENLQHESGNIAALSDALRSIVAAIQARLSAASSLAAVLWCQLAHRTILPVSSQGGGGSDQLGGLVAFSTMSGSGRTPLITCRLICAAKQGRPDAGSKTNLLGRVLLLFGQHGGWLLPADEEKLKSKS